ncbi:MAG: pilus assembly protein N-terminal domain-containing protein, partial [Roseiarcus sp.]
MTNSPFARASALSIGALIALFAMAPPALAGDEPAPSVFAVAPGAVKSLQLGVGKSVIVDLPEDAAEIFVGEPKVANAIVRSARRIYVSTLSDGQTTIFALAADGRKIAVLEVSVGRDVGELTTLLNAAIPGNDIHVRTVSESIILTGSVASAGDAQKAYDIATGFLSSSPNAGTGSAARAGAAAAPA